MYTIGADLGATKLAMALVRGDGLVIREAWVPHRIRTTQDLTETFNLAVGSLLLERYIDSGEVSAVGVASAGWIDIERKELVGSPILGLDSVPLADLLSVPFRGVPVILQNDGDATLWGEYVGGAARGAKSALLFTIGSGVGGSIITNGQLLQGANGFASELGHMPVAGSYSLRCVCGNIGCLETVAGGRSLERTAQSLQSSASSPWPKAGRPVGARELGEAADSGNPAALRELHKAANAIADAVAMLIPVLDPDVVIIGGSVADGIGHLLLPAMSERLEDVAFLRARRGIPRIVRAELGPKAAVLGAADFAGHASDKNQQHRNGFPTAQL